MNGTFVITYRITPFGDHVASQTLKLDGRKSLKNMVNEAKELTKKVGHGAFRIVKMEGGDWVHPLEDSPLYAVS